MLIAQSGTWLDAEWWWAIAQVAIGLGFVIFVHELGHFLVAKACGVKCEKFYVGFDFFDIKIGDLVLIPRSLVKWQWGETEYGVGILPLGGYVKMLGQDDNPGNMEEEIQRSKAEDGEADAAADDIGLMDRDKMDPRSFLAKSVLQRMAIISAGVVFNLIFAVIFAAIAFKSGVSYSPPVVGDVTPGGPAWEANLYGASIKQIGDSKVEGYYQFIDLAQAVALSGESEPIELQYTLPGSTELKKASVTPRNGLNEMVDLALIGIQPSYLPKINGVPKELYPGHPAADAEPPFKDGDLIVAINDEQVESMFDLKRILARRFSDSLEFVVERATSEEVDADTEQVRIRVGANVRRETGLIMKWGPITSIQADSPAEKAGFTQGDQITAINGYPLGDLFSLEQRMASLAIDSKEVTFSVMRDKKETEIKVTPQIPAFFAALQTKQPVAINSLGIAVQTSRIVAASDIEGIDVGDEITKIEFPLEDPAEKEIFEKRIKTTSIDLTEPRAGWEMVSPIFQTLPAGFNFKVHAVNGDQTKEALATTRASDQYFLPTRGVPISQSQETYQVANWQEAVRQGAYQTGWDASRVFRFLGKLVKGQISPKNLGGPGMIAVAATNESSQGTPRLLLFLTLLSANLAIVNFLPIPVLDGGHMLFLAYEGLFRQPPNEKLQIILTYAGLFVILGLMLYVILLDISRFSDWF